jgi:hypothetical protein
MAIIPPVLGTAYQIEVVARSREGDIICGPDPELLFMLCDALHQILQYDQTRQATYTSAVERHDS